MTTNIDFTAPAWESIDLQAGATEGDVLLGTAHLWDGTPMHVTAIRVNPDSDIQEALNDPLNRLEDFAITDSPDAPYVTASIPGFDGEYVVWLSPHGV